MQKQFQKIFPNGYNAHIEEQENNAFDFSEIKQAIINATDEDVGTCLETPNNGTALGQALNDFRDQFTQKTLSEKVFNPYHVLKALETYENQYNALQTWGKRSLFCIQIIGYCQSRVSACYAQVFAQGVYDLIEDENPLVRSFKFTCYDKYIKEFSVRPRVDFDGLGFKYYVGAAGGRRAWRVWPGVAGVAVSWHSDMSWRVTKTYVKQKQQAFRTYAAVAPLNGLVCNNVK